MFLQQELIIKTCRDIPTNNGHAKTTKYGHWQIFLVLAGTWVSAKNVVGKSQKYAQKLTFRG